jgi:hypothetical protein
MSGGTLNLNVGDTGDSFTATSGTLNVNAVQTAGTYNVAGATVNLYVYDPNNTYNVSAGTLNFYWDSNGVTAPLLGNGTVINLSGTGTVKQRVKDSGAMPAIVAVNGARIAVAGDNNIGTSDGTMGADRDGSAGTFMGYSRFANIRMEANAYVLFRTDNNERIAGDFFLNGDARMGLSTNAANKVYVGDVTSNDGNYGRTVTTIAGTTRLEVDPGPGTFNVSNSGALQVYYNYAGDTTGSASTTPVDRHLAASVWGSSANPLLSELLLLFALRVGPDSKHDSVDALGASRFPGKPGGLGFSVAQVF